MATQYDHQSIANTISRYCIALDTKNFELLNDVFTAHVDANYPFNNHLDGVEAVKKAIAKRLAPITSQHALTTQIIEMSLDGRTAKATTYFTGIHFGKGKWQGKEVTAWGKYEDELIIADGQEQGVVFNMNGNILYRKWLISKRTVGFMGRLGEEGVMDGE